MSPVIKYGGFKMKYYYDLFYDFFVSLMCHSSETGSLVEIKFMYILSFMYIQINGGLEDNNFIII